jgi:ABC-type microcin C transport system permease subunit YejE
MMGNSFWLLTLTLMLFNGPLGSVLILITTPYLLKHSGKNYLGILNNAK